MARLHHTTAIFQRTLFALGLLLASLPAFSQVYRTAHSPMDAVGLTDAQKKKMDKVDAKYGPKLEALVKNEDQTGEDNTDAMDSLNKEYTRALLSVMTDKQKLEYLKEIYARVMDFSVHIRT